MPTGKKKAPLGARPAGHDYASEIAARLAGAPCLFHSVPNTKAGGKALLTSSSQNVERRPYAVVEGVAILEITGYLCNEAYWWDETQYSDVQDELAMAIADAEVKGILLRVDSYGGETDGAFEAADAILAARKEKPVWAVADVNAYSAAYLLASQAQRVFAAPKSGGVGSIGVYMLHMDYSKMLDEAGIKPTFIKAGDGKTAGNPYEPLSTEAKARFQAEIDRLYAEFTAAVSRGRKMSVDAIKTLGAWLYQADAAQSSGLADKLGTFEDAWAALATKVQEPGNSLLPGSASVSAPAGNPTAAAAGAPKTEGDTMEPKTPSAAEPGKDPAAPPPAPTQADVDRQVTEARAAGFGDAQEVAALCAIAGKPLMALDFISKKTSAADVRTALLAAANEGDEITNKRPEGKPGAGAEGDLGAAIVASCKKFSAQAQKGA